EVVGVYISGHPLDDFRIEMDSFTNCKVSHFNHLEDFINKEMCFAGIVSEVKYMTGKNGRDWAIFTEEDFEDSFELRIFGEEYLKYRHLLVMDTFIYARVFIKEGWVDRTTGKKGEPRLQYNHIQMLHDVIVKYPKKITLEIHLNILDEHKIRFSKSLVKSPKGEKQLHLLVYEKDEEINLDMRSRKHKVDISKKMLEE